MRIIYKKLLIAILLLIFIYIPSTAYSATDLFSFSRQGINFAISQDNNNIVLKVSSPNIANVNKFALTNPSRIVIDMQGIKIGRSENIGINNVPLINSIRLGAHPPYTTRMVIDLSNNSPFPNYTTFLNMGELTVILTDSSASQHIPNTFNGNANMPSTVSLNAPNVIKIGRIPNIANQVPAMQQNVPTQALPTVPTVPTVPTAPTAPSVPSMPTINPTIQPTVPSLDNKPSTFNAPIQKSATYDGLKGNVQNKDYFANASGCVLTAIYFDNDVTSSPIVKVSLNRKNDFKIVKFSSEQYKITIPNCKLAAKNLELPFFPPPEFKNFVFIQAKDTSNNVEVSIGVEENTSLVNLQRDNEIWVKPQN